MLIARQNLDLILKAHDRAFETSIQALGDARDLVVAAKQCEIDRLQARVDALEKALAYERARADALVDRLLVRDAKVAAVALAAVAAATEKDLAMGKTRNAIQEVFDKLADLGEPPAPGEPRAFDFAGGGEGVAGV